MRIPVSRSPVLARVAAIVAVALAIGRESAGDTAPPRRPASARDTRAAGQWDVSRRDGLEALEEKRYPEAEKLLQQAVAEATQLGPAGSEQAQALGSLGFFYLVRKQHAEAEPLLTRALDIEEKVYGPASDEVAGTLNQLALVETAREQYDAAETRARRALAIREKELGPDDPEVAHVLNTLAGIFFMKKEFDKAEPIWARALAIQEKALGPDHLSVARTLQNKAVIRIGQGMSARIEAMMTGAENLRFRPAPATSKDDPKDKPADNASAKDEDAIRKQSLAYFDHAETLLERVLTIREKTQGVDHEDYLEVINYLVHTYELHGDRAHARPWMERSLAIREKVHGPDHPNVAEAVLALAVDHMDHAEYRSAEPLLRRALGIQQKGMQPRTKEAKESEEFTSDLLRKALAMSKLLDDPALRPTEADLTYLKGLKDGIDEPDVPSLLNRTWLIIGDPKFDDAGLVHLERLTNLEDLEFFTRAAFTDAGLAHLAKLAKLKELSFFWPLAITDAGLAHLETLTNLQTLSLRGDKITDAGLAHIRKLTKLTRLGLIGTPIRGPGLAHLRDMASLRQLNLECTALDDAGLADLPPLPMLEKLHLDGTKVGDAGIVHLTKFAGLKVVSLSDTNVTDAGVVDLKRALPNVSASLSAPAFLPPVRPLQVPGKIGEPDQGTSPD